MIDGADVESLFDDNDVLWVKGVVQTTKSWRDNTVLNST